MVGSSLTTKAHVRVSSKVVAGNNISKQWTGSQLPAAIVSNTGGDDSANTLNDLTVSRANTDVKNRWTTWQTGTDNDWASILFGNSGDLTKRFVDNLSVDFYTDGAIGLPKNMSSSIMLVKKFQIYQLMSIMLKEMPSIHLTMLTTGKRLNISKHQDNYLQAKLTTLHLIRLRPMQFVFA